MARRKDIASEELKKSRAEINRLDNPTPDLERALHQDFSLSKGERQKGSSPAYAMGKKVEGLERKRG